MKVQELMSRKLITVSPEDTVEVAIQLLRQRGIRHLLVMKGERLVGIVSDRDFKRAMDPEKTRKKLLGIGGLFFLIEPILVREIMTPHPITIGPHMTVQDAAAFMVTHHFGALPVEEEGRTIGIVTETDLLSHFAQSGQEKPAEEKKSLRESESPGSEPRDIWKLCGRITPGYAEPGRTSIA
jgi:acetoin utilization protein AcuB